MAIHRGDGSSSPWRPILERVRSVVGSERDEHGVVGSINWLRLRMKERGANPNVVRNILYRDKGRPGDKRVLFELLNELWTAAGNEPLEPPGPEVLLAATPGAEREASDLLGRDKLRAFRAFVGALREGRRPKMLVTGRSGSGKTMLTDYVQRALGATPSDAPVVRVEFGSGDLGATLVRLGVDLGQPRDGMEARLTKIAARGAYAVQADAQAELARAILDAARERDGDTVLLVNVSRALAGQTALGGVPLRLNTARVPRVTAPEWLWAALLAPLAAVPRVALLVTTADLPSDDDGAQGAFGAPYRLTPPTTAEARRFVRARLPQLPPAQQDEIVARAGRSFEELRTLALLAEVRSALPERDREATVSRVAALVVGGDERLRDFLAAMAVLSLPEYPAFDLAALGAVRRCGEDDLRPLERAFVDPVPGPGVRYRPFSRAMARALRDRLANQDPNRFRALHRAAADLYGARAGATRGSEDAARRLHHLFLAREWAAMVPAMREQGLAGSLASPVWRAAQDELRPHDPGTFDALAEQVARHYVKLGSYRHPDAVQAFAVLVRSPNRRRRDWATMKRAEGAILAGRHQDAVADLDAWQEGGDAVLDVEATLLRASIARWRGDLDQAAHLVEREARRLLGALRGDARPERLARAKVALWAGMIHKDRGRLDDAIREFEQARPIGDLLRARLRFRSGDVHMQLGLLGAAAERLDDAVALAARSGALASERARYHAHRATLRYRQGDLTAADHDLDVAEALLAEAEGTPAERGFWCARVHDGRALLHLARGHHDQAITLLAGTVGHHRAYAGSHGVDCAYRIDRSLLRLGIAYASRALGAPWLPPFPHRPPEPFARPDLTHARRLLSQVIARRAREAGPHQPLDPLGRRALLTASLLEPPAEAARLAERTTAAAHYPFLRAESRAHLAAALLRAGDVDRCLHILDAADDDLRALGAEPTEPGLRAWLVALRLRALVSADAPGAAMRALADLLHAQLPETMRADVLRAFGEALEVEDRPSWLDDPRLPPRLRGGDDDAPLRPSDRLVRRWATRDEAAVAALGTVA